MKNNANIVYLCTHYNDDAVASHVEKVRFRMLSRGKVREMLS
jgi:hypothetical protein